jgi:NAD(P)H dehydrogenase (quinone)
VGKLSVPTAFVRAAWFMDNCAWDVKPARETGIIQSHLQPLDQPVPMVSTIDVGHLISELLQERWTGRRIVDLEGPLRVTPNDVAATFEKLLGHPVREEIVPRENWEAIFRAQGMEHPLPRMQMLDGFNEGWIKFKNGEADSRKGTTSLEIAVKALIAKT